MVGLQINKFQKHWKEDNQGACSRNLYEELARSVTKAMDATASVMGVFLYVDIITMLLKKLLLLFGFLAGHQGVESVDTVYYYYYSRYHIHVSDSPNKLILVRQLIGPR